MKTQYKELNREYLTLKAAEPGVENIVGVSKDKQEAQAKFAQALDAWGEKVACGHKTIGTLRTTYLVNEEGIIEKIFTPKETTQKLRITSKTY